MIQRTFSTFFYNCEVTKTLLAWALAAGSEEALKMHKIQITTSHSLKFSINTIKILEKFQGVLYKLIFEANDLPKYFWFWTSHFWTNQNFDIFLLNNFSCFLNLNLFPVLSSTPHPPGGIQNSPKDYLG